MQALDFLFGDRGLLPLTPRDSPRPQRHQETPLYQTPRASPRIQTPNRNTVTRPLDLPDGMLRDHTLTWA